MQKASLPTHADGPACLFGSNLGSSQNNGRPLGGVLVYTWKGTLPSTRGDLLSLTFQTTTQDATLIQVRGESHQSKADYLKLKIVSPSWCSHVRRARTILCWKFFETLSSMLDRSSGWSQSLVFKSSMIYVVFLYCLIILIIYI